MALARAIWDGLAPSHNAFSLKVHRASSCLTFRFLCRSCVSRQEHLPSVLERDQRPYLPLNLAHPNGNPLSSQLLLLKSTPPHHLPLETDRFSALGRALLSTRILSNAPNSTATLLLHLPTILPGQSNPSKRLPRSSESRRDHGSHSGFRADCRRQHDLQ